MDSVQCENIKLGTDKTTFVFDKLTKQLKCNSHETKIMNHKS